MKEKRNIKQEPEYQELVKLLDGMSAERVALLEQVLDDLQSEKSGDYYLTQQAAEKLGLSAMTIRLWIRQGKLKAKRIGARWRIPVSEVNRLLAESEG